MICHQANRLQVYGNRVGFKIPLVCNRDKKIPDIPVSEHTFKFKMRRIQLTLECEVPGFEVDYEN